MKTPMFLFVLCALALSLFAPPTLAAPDAPRYGLSVVNGEVRLAGKPFRGMGVNYFDAFHRTLIKADDTTYEKGFRELAAAGIPFARITGGGFWPNEQRLYTDDPKEFFRRFDAVVASAERNGVGLIVSLFWNATTTSDLVGEPRSAWAKADSKTQERMRRYVRDVVTRYRDSPAIWGWEISNEQGLNANLPNAKEHRPAVVPDRGTAASRSEADDLTVEMVRAMYEAVGREIRRYDPYRVLSSGDAFPRPSQWHQWKENSWTKDTDEQRRTILVESAPDPIDLTSVHAYGDSRLRILESVAWAKASGKPLFVGEFGVQGFDRSKVEPEFEEMVKTIVDSGVPLSALWVFDRPAEGKEQYNVTATNERAYQLKRISEVNAAWRKAGLQPASPKEQAAQSTVESVAFPVRVENGAFGDARGRAFAPRGFNYIRLFDGRSHNTFDPEHYDTATVEKALRRWQDDGFNVVRVFINGNADLPGSLVRKGEAGFVKDYVRNVADFLVRARSHGIAVVLCTESFPRVAPYTDGLLPAPTGISSANAEYLEFSHVEAKAQFLKDLIVALKAARPGSLDAVFSYDLQNEFCFHGSAPFTLESGEVVLHGKTYAMPGQRQELADDAAVYFIDRMADAIREAHPRALVGASVFTYAAVGRTGPGDFRVKEAAWQNRIPFRPQAILRSKADYGDLHFYAADLPALERDLASVEFDAVREDAKRRGKPLIVGEYGVFKKAIPEIASAAAWMGNLSEEFTRRGFAGWLYWTYDTHEQSADLWHACDADSAIYRALSAR